MQCKSPVLIEGVVGMKLAEGEVAITASGRHCTPFPKVDLSTSRRSINTLRRVDKWLIQNIIMEAQDREDSFNLPVFQAMTAKNLSVSDKDTAEIYLFDKASIQPTKRSFLKPI